MKPRCDSVLFKLDDDQQAQLYQWLLNLGYQKTKERVALPPPDGFGLKTHLNSLHRFGLRYAEILKEREFMDLVRSASQDPTLALRATEGYAHHIAFELASSPDCRAHFRQLARWIGHLKEAEYKRARLKLDEERLAFETQKLQLPSSSAPGASPSL